MNYRSSYVAITAGQSRRRYEEEVLSNKNLVRQMDAENTVDLK